MAKILTTAIVADIRNKLNGSVFSKNRYGGYVRTKVTPVNPQTIFQQLSRSLLSTNSQAWRGLTESQREAWIAAAANFPFTDIYGNTKILSGSALYVKFNTNLLRASGTPISDPPSPVALPVTLAGALTAAAGTPALSLAFDTTPVPADFALQVYATPNITPGRSFVKNQYRLVSTLAAAATSPANLLADYSDRFGNPVAGQKIFVKIAAVSLITGQLGTASSAMAVVAP